MTHRPFFRQFACLALLVFSPLLHAEEIPTSALHALDGMAPEGRWAARLTLLRNSYTRRFDNTGHLTDLDTGYQGLDLSGFSLMPGGAPLAGAKLNLDTKIVTEYSELMFGYGLTKDLTLGAIIPYARTTNHVNYSVSNGANAVLQGALTSGLGYKPLGTTASAGFGDPTIGLLWRFHKGERDSAIFGFGVRLGLARKDDPNNLLDVPPGDGSTDLRTRLEYFRDLGRGFDLRLLAEYQIQLPDHVTLRPGNLLTTVATERLKRDLGDYWEFDVEVGKSFGNWRYSATWHRYQEGPDRYTSPNGTDTSFLSANTDTLADQYRLAVTWSGIKEWQAGRLPLPLIIKLEMQDAFRGRNFVDVRDIYLRVTSFF